MSYLLADETIVPPDVPSYLSSQGTLSDRQETVVRTEGGHQANGHIESNGKASKAIVTVSLGGGLSYSPAQVPACTASSTWEPGGGWDLRLCTFCQV